MQQFSKMPSREIFPGYTGRFIHGENSTTVFWEIKAGSRAPMHQHMNEQVTYILEGDLEMNIGGEEIYFSSGCVHVIPPNTLHNAFAVTDCKVIDFFSPARDDYRFE